MQTFFDSAKEAFHENSNPLENELREGITDDQWQLIKGNIYRGETCENFKLPFKILE